MFNSEGLISIPGIFFVVIVFYLLRVVFDKKYSRTFREISLDVGITFILLIIFQYFMDWLFS